ncbi:MAG: DUF983 domain-containing protein [Bacteroidetes bacterium]|nr:DUF983 domain-containing protein [Bacteroidota bacterium]MDA0902853.1 DUF983 domain-containing protein [Bacteroidota bacterium]MDA1241994.1 DUF983 domain-containing protein [Bacteroidota bacterium]
MPKLTWIIQNRCPRCGEGALFENPNAYLPKTTAKMKAQCTSCGEDFAREPGFYFGAAYVSYALTVALWVAVLVALKCFDAWGWMEFGMFTHPGTFLLTGISLLVSLLPLIYRLSRSIWIAMFTPKES